MEEIDEDIKKMVSKHQEVFDKFWFTDSNCRDCPHWNKTLGDCCLEEQSYHGFLMRTVKKIEKKKEVVMIQTMPSQMSFLICPCCHHIGLVHDNDSKGYFCLGCNKIIKEE